MERVVWIAAVVLALAGIAYGVRKRSLSNGLELLIQRCLRMNGAGRCTGALAVLHLVRDRGDAGVIPQVWDRIEMPLLQALSDCPPSEKTHLRQALEDVSEICRHRDTSHRLMTMRDALVEVHQGD